ncbi:unnamed protein product [Effrenium voratum]|uniref:Nucleotide-diphospho-sugar transferase domain-containing protein n=1 Tax=Effrenium voratum TaxID=2562239 RepID=A0AA36IVC1_9DINO|nr:unnamed protein product [Effrenium voratum]
MLIYLFLLHGAWGVSVSLPKPSAARLEVMCEAEAKSRHELLQSWVARIWQSAEDKDVSPSRFHETDADGEARRYTLQVDTEKLRRAAGPGRRLVVSWTTGGPKRWAIAHNLALSVRQNAPQLERIFVFIALDPDAVARAEAAGFQAVLNENSTDLQDDIWKMRWLILTTCISIGLEVLVVDSDIVFLADPFQQFFFDSDLEAMTDHFFPAEQLWATWLRPAEHINTGFLFARPSRRLLDFLTEFIDLHYHAYEGPTLRDGMDQRVFNKFVMGKMETFPPEVLTRYENLAFPGLDWQNRTSRFTPRSTWRIAQATALARSLRAISLRILDPVCISHGMNYFWRKAYKLARCGGVPGGAPPVVHVNGVDPKMYFLRDRNLWYVDDWGERMKDAFFLTYEHPRGLSLADDFEVLVAALELAAYFRRRVVLPDRMNCANNPAFHIYKLNETMADEPGCTYDYFAHANGLYEVYSRVKPYAIEAGVARDARFAKLASASLPTMQELQGGVLREQLLSLQGNASAVAFGPAKVLRISEDVRLLRDGLRSGHFGLRMNAEKVFSCAYQEPLIGAMACLDEPYVEEFGADAMCDADSFVTGCGPVGICCCWPFWGWGEKLQYFTGVPWDLPCNCGLSLCENFQRSEESCCRHAGSTALFPVTDPGVFYCKGNGSWSGPTGAEDSNTYTSQALIEFASSKRTAAQSFETCSRDRLLRRGGAFRETSLRECNLQFSAYLLRRSMWPQLRTWLAWVFEERRGLGNSSKLIASMEGTLATDNTGFSAEKLAHDVDQLNYIAAGGGDIPPEALRAFRQLSTTFKEFQAGGARRAVEEDFAQVRAFFNRALHVPDFSFELSRLGDMTAFDMSGVSKRVMQSDQREQRDPLKDLRQDLQGPGCSRISGSSRLWN